MPNELLGAQSLDLLRRRVGARDFVQETWVHHRQHSIGGRFHFLQLFRFLQTIILHIQNQVLTIPKIHLVVVPYFFPNRIDRRVPEFLEKVCPVLLPLKMDVIRSGLVRNGS